MLTRGVLRSMRSCNPLKFNQISKFSNRLAYLGISNFHSKSESDTTKETIKIKFMNLKDNSEKVVDATVGDHILEVARKAHTYLINFNSR